MRGVPDTRCALPTGELHVSWSSSVPCKYPPPLPPLGLFRVKGKRGRVKQNCAILKLLLDFAASRASQLRAARHGFAAIARLRARLRFAPRAFAASRLAAASPLCGSAASRLRRFAARRRGFARFA